MENLGPDILSAVDQVDKAVATANAAAIANYEQSLHDWKRNKELYVAAKQPVPEKPKAPLLKVFDPDKYVSLLLSFHDKIVATIGHAVPGGEFSAADAFSVKPYVSPNDVLSKPAPAPAYPSVGEFIGGNRFQANDKMPNGSVFEPLGAAGPKFVKVVMKGVFGDYHWYEQVR